MPPGLLEPRLYRAAFAPALLALIILAFSLQDPPRSLAPELAPPTFNAARANAFALQLVANYGARESGSVQDGRVAELVRARLEESGFRASAFRFDDVTLNGSRELTNVVGVRPGPSDRRLLIVASRDGAPGKLLRAGAAETGVLLELARVLQGRAFDHTLVLASVSGGVDGGLGAAELARSLRGPVDGVLVLRNVAAFPKGSPVLSEFDSREFPDLRFVRTADRIAALELERAVDERSVGAQLIRLGFPIALGEQGTLPGRGLTAVALSPGGEPLAVPGERELEQVGAVGQTALRALTTFDGGFRPVDPAPRPLRVGGKLIPQWALVLLIGALIFPLLVAAIDGWARSRRWHQVSARGLVAPPMAFVWLLLLGVLLRGVGLSGVIDAPPLPADPLAITGSAPIVIGFIVLILAALGVMVASGAARQATPKGGEAGFALWIVFAAIAVFVVNPVAAGFLLLLMHLIVLLLLAGSDVRRAKLWLFFAIGVLPLIAVVVYFPVVFGLSPLAALRFAVMLEAGGYIGILAVAAASAFVAAIGTALLHLHWGAPRPRRPDPLNNPFGRS